MKKIIIVFLLLITVFANQGKQSYDELVDLHNMSIYLIGYVSAWEKMKTELLVEIINKKYEVYSYMKEGDVDMKTIKKMFQKLDDIKEHFNIKEGDI